MTLMPMSWAAPISSLTARIALPSLVFWTRKVSTAIERIETMMVSMAGKLRVVPPKEMLGPPVTAVMALDMSFAPAPKMS